MFVILCAPAIISITIRLVKDLLKLVSKMYMVYCSLAYQATLSFSTLHEKTKKAEYQKSCDMLCPYQGWSKGDHIDRQKVIQLQSTTVYHGLEAPQKRHKISAQS